MRFRYIAPPPRQRANPLVTNAGAANAAVATSLTAGSPQTGGQITITRGTAPAKLTWGRVSMKPTKVLIAAVAMALACGPISGCTSIATYEVSHPYYRFPVSGCGGCGGAGG
jgi:hypothetical protein